MPEEPKQPRPWTRRLFLKSLAVLGFAAAWPAKAWAVFLDRFPVRTVEKRTFDFDPETGRVLWSDGVEEEYALVIDGLAAEPVRLTYADLRALPSEAQVSDFHCVEGWSTADLSWRGIRFSTLLDLVQARPGADFAVFHSLGQTRSKPGGLDHYVECFPVERLLDPKNEILLALDLNGRPLPLEHGAPLRVVSPYDLAYKSIKFVRRVELTAERRPGWWTRANPMYPSSAPVPEKRLRNK